MEHAIQGLKSHYEVALDRLYEEWDSGKYRRLGQCPQFNDCLTYREALNVLQHISNSDILSDLLEDLETFAWMNHTTKIDFTQN